MTKYFSVGSRLSVNAGNGPCVTENLFDGRVEVWDIRAYNFSYGGISILGVSCEKGGLKVRSQMCLRCLVVGQALEAPEERRATCVVSGNHESKDLDIQDPTVVSHLDGN